MDLSHLNNDEKVVEARVRGVHEFDEGQMLIDLQIRLDAETNQTSPVPDQPHESAASEPKREIAICSRRLNEINHLAQHFLENAKFDKLKVLLSRSIHYQNRIARLHSFTTVRSAYEKLTKEVKGLIDYLEALVDDNIDTTKFTGDSSITITVFDESYYRDVSVTNNGDNNSSGLTQSPHPPPHMDSIQSTGQVTQQPASMPLNTTTTTSQNTSVPASSLIGREFLHFSPQVSSTIASSTPRTFNVPHSSNRLFNHPPNPHVDNTPLANRFQGYGYAPQSTPMPPQSVPHQFHNLNCPTLPTFIPQYQSTMYQYPNASNWNGFQPPNYNLPPQQIPYVPGYLYSEYPQSAYPHPSNPYPPYNPPTYCPPQNPPRYIPSPQPQHSEPPQPSQPIPISQPIVVQAPTVSEIQVTKRHDTMPLCAPERTPRRNINYNLMYDGASDGQNIERFLYRFEALARTYGVASDSLVDEIHFVLQGRALNHYWSIREQRQETLSWGQLKAALTERFKDRRTDFDVRRCMDFRRQKRNESFLEFYSDIRDMSIPLATQIRDDDLIMLLMRNMSSDLQNKLAGESFHRVSDLVERCIAIEDTWNRLSGSTAMNKRVDEVSQSTSGADDFHPENERDMSLEAFRLAERNTQRNPGHATNNRQGDICWNCTNPGHRYMDCGQPPLHVFCYGCGAPNVIKPHCVKCNPKSGNVSKDTMTPGNRIQMITTEDAASNTDPELRRRQQDPNNYQRHQ